MAVDPSVWGPATLAITSSIGLFSDFLPKFTEIKNSSPSDPGSVTDVHLGEIAAAALTLGIGAIVSFLTGSAIPIYVSVVMIVALMFLYESALKYQGPANA